MQHGSDVSMPMKSTGHSKQIKTILIVTLFSIAFAYIESAVVVYLRYIFHPEGFIFPLNVQLLQDSAKSVLLVEVGREAATLVLILTACWLFGVNARQRFAYFLLIFAVWDIFYYVWLKIFLDWPASIMDWDILFLIPVVWASSVLAPVLVSLLMAAAAITILYFDHIGRPLRAGAWDWIIISMATVAILVQFCIAGVNCHRPNYPAYFNWWLFTIPLLLYGGVLVRCVRRSLKSNPAACRDIRQD